MKVENKLTDPPGDSDSSYKCHEDAIEGKKRFPDDIYVNVSSASDV